MWLCLSFVGWSTPAVICQVFVRSCVLVSFLLIITDLFLCSLHFLRILGAFARRYVVFIISTLVSYAVCAFVIPFLFWAFFEGVALLGAVAARGFFLRTTLSRVSISVAFIASCYDCEGFYLAGLPLDLYPVRVRNHLPDLSTYFYNPLSEFVLSWSSLEKWVELILEILKAYVIREVLVMNRLSKFISVIIKWHVINLEF